MKHFKQTIAGILSAAIVLTCLSCVAVSAAKPARPPFNIVTLGDSIGRGYNVEDHGAPCYSRILANFIEDQVADAQIDAAVSYKNFAKDGWMTVDVVDAIDTDDECIAAVTNASVVNISLGGNELIQFLLKQCCKALEIPYNRNTVGDDILKAIGPVGSNPLTNPQVQKILQLILSWLANSDFPDLTTEIALLRENSVKLVDKIVKLNPDVKIVYNTIPRPTHADGISQILDVIIDRRFIKTENPDLIMGQDTFNKAILDKFGITDPKIDIEVVDSFKYFFENSNNENPLTFAYIDLTDLSTIVLDPHPNDEGQAKIAELHKPIFQKLYNEMYLEKPLPGDVTGDDKLDTRDSLTILKFLVGMTSLDAKQQSAADYNKDGRADTRDSLEILKTLVA